MKFKWTLEIALPDAGVAVWGDSLEVADLASFNRPPGATDAAKLLARQIAETLLVRVFRFDENKTSVEVVVR